jgi:2Fe-2S ferredoxin
MPKILFIEASGQEHMVEAKAGQSLMQAATDHLVPGILADCGGYCNCATCHCYIEPAWAASLPAPDSMEKDMLDCAIDPQDNSRLSCQVQITDAMDGMVVRLPVSQT